MSDLNVENYRSIICKTRTVSRRTEYQNSRMAARMYSGLLLSPSLSHFVRAHDALYTRVYIWVKYKRKQSLVKHNTLENFSLATDVSAGIRFPVAMYVHRIRRYWHSLLGITGHSSPRLIFRSHYRGNPKWAQPASGHPQALQTRNCPSDSEYRVPRLPSLRKYLHSNTGFLLSPRYLVAHLAFSSCDLIESLQFGLSSLSWTTLVTVPTLVTVSVLVIVG